MDLRIKDVAKQDLNGISDGFQQQEAKGESSLRRKLLHYRSWMT